MLADCGVTSAEFGELSWPQIENILRRGKPENASAADTWNTRKAIAAAKRTARQMKEQALG